MTFAASATKRTAGRTRRLALLAPLLFALAACDINAVPRLDE